MKNKGCWLLLALGILIIAVGGFVLYGIVPKPVGGVSIGIGGALIGITVSELLKRRMLEKNPAVKRKMEIDERDERNITINSRAKAKAFDAMTPVFGMTMLVLILTDVALYVTLLGVGAYLAMYIVYFFNLSKYNKEM